MLEVRLHKAEHFACSWFGFAHMGGVSIKMLEVRWHKAEHFACSWFGFAH